VIESYAAMAIDCNLSSFADAAGYFISSSRRVFALISRENPVRPRL
jgi:hypothetical protein